MNLGKRLELEPSLGRTSKEGPTSLKRVRVILQSLFIERALVFHKKKFMIHWFGIQGIKVIQ